MDEIARKTFNHGWWYFYHVHLKKMQALCVAYPALQAYLTGLLDDCPQEPFQTGPRSSKARVAFTATLTEIEHHPVCSLAQDGLDSSRYKTKHMNVQMWMLQHDLHTLAIETPLWLKEQEHAAVHAFMGTSGPLSGHIDALRIEGDKIWIWDYKPDAHKEKHASLQTFLYALMLEARTGIPITQMRCGYFDEHHAYAFAPSHALLDRGQLVTPSLVPTRMERGPVL